MNILGFNGDIEEGLRGYYIHFLEHRKTCIELKPKINLIIADFDRSTYYYDTEYAMFPEFFDKKDLITFVNALGRNMFQDKNLDIF